MPASEATASNSRPALEVSGAFTPRAIIVRTHLPFDGGEGRDGRQVLHPPRRVAEHGRQERHRGPARFLDRRVAAGQRETS